MPVKIGSARIDEHGRTSGGKAGDQTGSEVSTQNWYLHPKGWRTFRARDPERAERIASCMEAACANDQIGYDQGQRNSLRNAVQAGNFDVSGLSAEAETDCSALVRVCCAAAGIRLPDFTTATEADALLRSGAFDELRAKKYTAREDYLRRGDIQVTRSKGHTVVVLSDGPLAEPAVPPASAPAGTVTIADCTACNLREGPGTSFRVAATARPGDTFPAPDTGGWLPILRGDRLLWVSARYARKAGA